MATKETNFAVEVTKDENDPAVMSMGIDGYGSVKIEGTNQFMRDAMPMAMPMVSVFILEHVKRQEAQGRSFDEIEKEFMDKFEEAARKAGVDTTSVRPSP